MLRTITSLLFSELKHLWQNEDGFFGIGMGPTKEQKQQYSLEAGLANFATGLGEKELLQSDTFWSSILGGDPNAIARVLGPELSGISAQSEQEKKTASEFGNRGGGTNAAMQMSGERATSTIDQLIASLTGQAAGQLGGQGSGLLSLGSSAHGQAFDMASVIQKLKSAKWNDLFKSIADVGTGVAGMFTKGTPAFPGMTGADISKSYGGPSEAPTTTSDLPWSGDGLSWGGAGAAPTTTSDIGWTIQ